MTRGIIHLADTFKAGDRVTVEYKHRGELTPDPYIYYRMSPGTVQANRGAADSATSVIYGTASTVWTDNDDATYWEGKDGVVGTAAWAETYFAAVELPTMPADAICEFHMRVSSPVAGVSLNFSPQLAEQTQFSVNTGSGLGSAPVWKIIQPSGRTAESVARLFRSSTPGAPPSLEVRPSNTVSGNSYRVYEFFILFKVLK